MTDKAQKVLQKMKHWKRLNNRRRDKILNEFNRENLDDVGPLGSDQGMAVLNEMNDLGSGRMNS